MMNKVALLIAVATLTFACKQKEVTKPNEKELTTAEKIANAHGFAEWQKVSELQFTFNVDKDTTHFERSWSWKPKSGDIVMISGKDSLSYNRQSIDSTSTGSDKSFINDKYWLLAPFQLLWDTSASISEVKMAEAPISKKQLNQITITYTDAGGYTPGDAYDLYFGDDYLIQEWVFRKGNAKEPSMVTTWEDYEDYNGIKISKTHKRSDMDWKLHFTNIKILK